MLMDLLALGVADSGADAISSGVVSSFKDLADDAKDMMVKVLPYALGVMGLSWGVVKAKGFFKRAS